MSWAQSPWVLGTMRAVPYGADAAPRPGALFPYGANAAARPGAADRGRWGVVSVLASRGRDARAALVTSWLVLAYLVVQLAASTSLRHSGAPPAPVVPLAVLTAALTAGGVLRLQQRVLAGDDPRAPAALRWAPIAAVAFVPVLPQAWALGGLSLAAVLLSSGWPRWLPIGALVTGVLVLALVARDASAATLIEIPMACWLSAGVVLVLTRMAMVLEALHAAQEHLARLRVDAERHRIARDVHDILGRSLVAVSLRSQTALRLLDTDAGAARHQLEHVGRTVEAGRVQLSRLVHGDVIIDLDSEVASAVELFDRLCVEHDVEVDAVPCETASSLAARVVREAVTNMLKHSRPRWASIRVRDDGVAVVVTATNDGAPYEPPCGGGTGLGDLAHRVMEARGTLHAGCPDKGRFRVTVRIPHAVALDPVGS